jgi:CRP-like cAMP-binding protein
MSSLTRSRRPDVSAFAGVPLFAGYDRRRLAPLARRVDRLLVMPGATLARAGSRPHEVVVVIAGDVVVERVGAEVGRLGPGAVIGASEELDGTAHDATFMADTGVEALVLTGRAFRWAVGSLPGLRERLQSNPGRPVRPVRPVGHSQPRRLNSR